MILDSLLTYSRYKCKHAIRTSDFRLFSRLSIFTLWRTCKCSKPAPQILPFQFQVMFYRTRIFQDSFKLRYIGCIHCCSLTLYKKNPRNNIYSQSGYTKILDFYLSLMPASLKHFYNNAIDRKILHYSQRPISIHPCIMQYLHYNNAEYIFFIIGRLDYNSQNSQRNTAPGHTKGFLVLQSKNKFAQLKSKP